MQNNFTKRILTYSGFAIDHDFYLTPYFLKPWKNQKNLLFQNIVTEKDTFNMKINIISCKLIRIIELDKHNYKIMVIMNYD